VEHHLNVIAGSDWVIDTGPGAGEEGGRIVAAWAVGFLPVEIARRRHHAAGPNPDKRASMRPPRYHFPDEVRSATREMAAQTVRAGTVASTAEEMDAWIGQAPDVREPLERGGYTTEFTAADLFPLYEVMVEKAGGAVPKAEVAAPSSSPLNGAMFAALAVAIAVIVALVLTLG
jgi:hypothetical protein